ncbi:MAG: DUF4412 domain-containing protein [Bacteroidia bacterium]
MKRFAFVVLSALAISVQAQNGAAIDYKISSTKGASGTMKINFSEFGHSSEFNMVVPQMPGGGITMKSLSMKSTPDVIYTINDKNKTYTEAKKAETQAQDTKTYSVKKVGEETVNGYKCIHAVITEGNETEDVWNTKDIKEYNKYAEAYNTNKRLGSEKREKALKEAGCDGFPVKVVHKGNEREGDMTMELVKMEKKNFSSTDFQLPTGYTKSDSSKPAGGAPNGAPQMKSQEELMKMTPEERAKYVEELKKKYGK